MRRAASLVILLLVLSGCGGGEADVPADAVAVVDGEAIARSEYDAVLDQTKKSYANQKREFPKAGSQEFQALRAQIVQFLVQREQFEQEAEDLDVEVTDEQVDARLEQMVKQYFGGDEKKYERQLAAQGMSDARIRAELRAQIVSEEIFARVTHEVNVTDAEVEKYYTENKAQFSRPDSRDVRHILVKTREQADEIYEQLQGGADFSRLAKRFSEDTSSKLNGGKLTISKGQTVAPFDQTAFLLEQNGISRPVKTAYGFHVIQALGEVKPAKTTPLKEVEKSIEQQLQQMKKNEAMTKWVDELKRDYEDEISYAVGFTPPPAAGTGSTSP
jgi:parvulin-like peptidyl-prolyl isomerase